MFLRRTRVRGQRLVSLIIISSFYRVFKSKRVKKREMLFLCKLSSLGSEGDNSFGESATFQHGDTFDDVLEGEGVSSVVCS